MNRTAPYCVGVLHGHEFNRFLTLISASPPSRMAAATSATGAKSTASHVGKRSLSSATARTGHETMARTGRGRKGNSNTQAQEPYIAASCMHPILDTTTHPARGGYRRCSVDSVFEGSSGSNGRKRNHMAVMKGKYPPTETACSSVAVLPCIVKQIKFLHFIDLGADARTCESAAG